MGSATSTMPGGYRVPAQAAAAAILVGYLVINRRHKRDPAAESTTGIAFVDVYIPSCALKMDVAGQSEPAQVNAVATDREDVYSMALTVTASLLEKAKVSAQDIGYVIVAIGCAPPEYCSSSVSTVVLQRLFPSDTEGCTVLDGKLGGASALFNAVRWVNAQSAELGKSAIVVTVDMNMPVSMGATCSASFGCGASAVIISRQAPLIIDMSANSLSRGDWSDSTIRSLEEGFQLFKKKWTVWSDDMMVENRRIENIVLQSVMPEKFGEAIAAITRVDASDKNKSILSGNSEIWMENDLSSDIGHTGAVSIFMNLAKLISLHGSQLVSEGIIIGASSVEADNSFRVLFSFLKCSSSKLSRLQMEGMQQSLNLKNRLVERDILSRFGRTALWDGVSKELCFDTLGLTPGTYYIDSFNKNGVPQYARKALSTPRISVVSSNDRTTAEVPGALSQGTVAKSEATEPTASAPTIRRNNQSYVWASGRSNVEIVVTGVSAGLPGRNGAVFPKNGSGLCNIRRIIDGENCIDSIPDDIKDKMLEKNVVQLTRGDNGKLIRNTISSYEQNINLCASLGVFDLTQYGVTESIANTMDKAVQVSVAAGLEALRDAGIVSGLGDGTSGWVLPHSMQQTTGIVYATSFPALDTAISEVSRFFQSALAQQTALTAVINSLRSKLLSRVPVDNDTDTAQSELPNIVESALQDLQAYIENLKTNSNASDTLPVYEFDRKFLFRVLVLGNAQLAQIVKARGPNMQTNAACAGSTQAVAFAYDMIQAGRAERMIVIAGDNASSDTLMPWLGNGFLALGAATTQADVSLAALPFDVRRTGMILGSGGIGMILESEEGAKRRHAVSTQNNPEYLSLHPKPFKCRVLGTLYSNSAFHGASLDRRHIAEELERFIVSIEVERGISRKEIAAHGVYFSHETCTNAEASKSCASNEIFALRTVFGDDLANLLILNTKGLTGHSMGVSFEDVVAAEVLVTGKVPPVANLQEPDPILGDLKYSTGGDYSCMYALRFAAGFGSQVAISLYGKY